MTNGQIALHIKQLLALGTPVAYIISCWLPRFHR